jgi:hypothetical protein
MTAKRAFADYVSTGSISVWVGDFRSEDDLDDYIDHEFPAHFGFKVPPQVVCEIGVKPAPQAIGQLVEGFSRSKTFDSKVVEAADAEGIMEASCMFIIYNFKYDRRQQTGNPRLTFIGSVPFPGFG